MNRMNRGWTLVVGAAMIAALAGTALGQDSKPADDEALKGPAVKDDAPGTRKFTQKGAQRGEQEIPLRVYMRSLEVLRGEKADAAVRLTEEQDSEIKSIMEGFQGDVAKFREAHQEEIKSLMAKLSPEDRKKAMQRMSGLLGNAGGERGAGRPGQKPGGEKGKRPAEKAPADDMMQQDDGMQPVDAAASEGAKDQLKKLAEQAPKPADAQAKLWNVLTAAQKPVVQKELERFREEQKKNAGKKTDQAKPGEGKPGADPIMDNPRIPAELKEKLKDMSPEERREAIRKYREENPQKGKGKGGGKGGDKKAPPDMDDVNVPSADEPK
jgi:hypothetical protein